MKVLGGLPKSRQDAEALFVKLRYKVDAALLDKFPELKVVATPATGLVHLDLDELARRGIEVVSLKEEIAFLSNLTATAELAWGLILAFHRRIPAAMDSVKKGLWDRDLFMGAELKGRTLGVIGLGRLGSMVARYGGAFGMTVLYSDPREANLDYAKRVTQDELLERSDVVTLHVHVSEKTRGMIGARQFARMKKKPYFVNTSRGELVDEKALLKALKTGQIKGAGLDVLCDEHQNTRSGKAAWHRKQPLIQYARKHENLLITPHLGGLTRDGIEAAEVFTADKLLSWQA